MNLNSPTLWIDCRSGSVEMRLGSGDLYVGMLDMSPGDRTALSSPSLTAVLTPADAKPSSEPAPAAPADSDGGTP